MSCEQSNTYAGQTPRGPKLLQAHGLWFAPERKVAVSTCNAQDSQEEEEEAAHIAKVCPLALVVQGVVLLTNGNTAQHSTT